MAKGLKGGKSLSDSICIFGEYGKATAKYDENDNIFVKIERKKKDDDSKLTREEISFLVVVIICVVLYIVLMRALDRIQPWKLDGYIVSMIFFIIRDIGINVVSFNKLGLGSFGKKINLEFRKNHGAEHMVINYTVKNNASLMIYNEIIKYSRFSTYCGTVFVTAPIIAMLVGEVLFRACNFRIPEIVIVVLSIIIYPIFPFNLLGLLYQVVLTSKPDKRNIQLAIAAMEGYNSLELENGEYSYTDGNTFELISTEENENEEVIK